MGTSFFTPPWQIKCRSLATAAIKENDNFLYPQKKVMSLLRCVGPPSQRGNIFKQRPRPHLRQLRRQSNTRCTSVWVKRFHTTAARAILHESELQVNCKQRLSR